MSYLAGLGFHYARLVNTSFLKAGILVLALFGVIAYTVYSNYPSPTDNVAKSYQSYPYILNVGLIFSVLIAFYTTFASSNDYNAFLRSRPIAFGLAPLLIIGVFANFWSDSYAARNASLLRRSLWLMIPALLLFGLAVFVSPKPTRTFLILLGLTILLSHVFLGIYGDRKMAVVAPLLAVVGFLVACGYFGSNVYPYTSQTMGGARPFISTLVLRPLYVDQIKATGVYVNAEGLLVDVKVLYEDADSYVLEGANANYMILKDAFLASVAPK